MAFCQMSWGYIWIDDKHCYFYHPFDRTVYTDHSKLKLTIDGVSLMPQTVASGADKNWK